MNRERRYRYSRPATEDRESLIDRLLWSSEYHEVVTRVLVAICVGLATVVIVYQISLAVAHNASAIGS